MKKLTVICFASFLMLALVPIISISAVNWNAADNSDATTVSRSDEISAFSDERTVTVFLETSERRVMMTELEYVCGVVACEMPMSYEDEALKAQAVAAFTMLRRRQENFAESNVSGSDSEFVISSSSSSVQGYITQEQMKAKWGGDFDENYARLKNLVASVADEYIAFDGKPILAAYHGISCGMTEDAGNVWGESLEYLSPVSSTYDSQAAGYASSAEFTADEFKDICARKLGIVLSGNSDGWLGQITRSNSSYVMSCEIGEEIFTGQKVRNAFGLRSACFTLKLKDGKFTFNVKGYGHGVGMSQFGANVMAKQGADYREIIVHYYKNTEILKV